MRSRAATESASVRLTGLSGILGVLLGLAGAGAGAGALNAASLPPHRSLRVLIVSDEVNPHGLSPAELTQPGELSVVLSQPGAGLDLDSSPDGLVELPTNDLATATALLRRPACDPSAYDVLVYFAHRIPEDGPDAQARQDAFTASVVDFLASGGGVVSFHHGAYLLPGKEGILDVIGGRATGAVPWEPVAGQDIIAVAPAHFIASNGLSWDGQVVHEDAGRGIPSGSFPFFNNAPDERYPTLDIDAGAGDIEILFASAYDFQPRLLGFVHRRPGWRADVIAWQPGEYQPHACDPLHRTFQILVNAIAHSVDAMSVENPILHVTREGAGVRLSWSGGRALQCVSRSSDPSDVSEPLGSTDAGEFDDPLPPPGLVAYLLRPR